MSCAEYDALTSEAKEERSSEYFVKGLAKRCPNEGCGWYVEKDGGCNNMFCVRCQTHWSWTDVKFDKV